MNSPEKINHNCVYSLMKHTDYNNRSNAITSLLITRHEHYDFNVEFENDQLMKMFVRAPPLGGCPIVITLSVRPSVRLSVCPSKNLNIGHNFFTFRDKPFIFGMCDPYDKTFRTVP